MHQWDSSNVVFHWPFWTKLSWVMPKIYGFVMICLKTSPFRAFGGLTPSVIHWHLVVSKPFRPGHSPIKTKIQLNIKWSNKLVYNECITDTNCSKVSKVRSNTFTPGSWQCLSQIPMSYSTLTLKPVACCHMLHASTETMASKISIETPSKTYWRVYHIICRDSDSTSSMVLV